MSTIRATLVAAALATAAGGVAAAAQPSWLRSPALSPDGQRIAFRHRGDLWTVAATGGEAAPLVQGAAFEGQPVWSPDGGSIAFASDRSGNLDIYVVPTSGGEPRRLTFHSNDELPSGFSADGRYVVFSSVRHDAALPLRYPHAKLPGTFRVATIGGAAEHVIGAPAEQARPAADGRRWLYAERKGGEMEWRKHERSPATWDLWLFDSATGRHRRLSERDWEHREPLWSPAEDAVFFLSERSGSFNVWRMTLAGEATAVQLTRHETHPVRSLSVSQAGDICYSHDGSIFMLPAAGGAPRQINVTFSERAAGASSESGAQDRADEITEFALSPRKDFLAFVVRGEVFLASAAGTRRRRLTTTPAKEAGLSFAPDGRSLAYASERDGRWQIYVADLTGQKPAAPAERRLFESESPSWLPRFSPDGRKLAFVDNGGLAVRDLGSGRTTALLARFSEFTRDDGNGYDIRWHPQSGHLAFSFADLQRPGSKVGFMAMDGGGLQSVSLNAYRNSQPRWASSGGWLAWLSDSEGWRDYGGSDVAQGVFAAPLEPRAALDLLALSASERSGRDRARALRSPATDAASLTSPVEPEARFSLTRLSPVGNGPRIEAFDIAPDGEAVLWVGKSQGRFEISRKLSGRPARHLAFVEGEELSQLEIGASGRDALLLIDGAIHEVAENGAARKLIGPLRVLADAAAERAALITHVGNYVEQVFFSPGMDRVRWRQWVARYRELAPAATTQRELKELLGELVGELNASHTEVYDWPYDPPVRDETAALGAVLQPVDAGYRIAFIAPGSPLRLGASPIQQGSVLSSIDGHPLSAGEDWHRWLNGKAGQLIELELIEARSGRRWKQKVVPLSQEENQERFYRAWAQERREKVRQLSGGRLAYAHMAWMEDGPFRDLYNEALSAPASFTGLIVDTRYNGGGWIHESLLPFLQGKFLFTIDVQGSRRDTHPEHAWTRPSAMLINSANYSNASETPRLYQSLGIGKLIGAPVAGTGLGGAETRLGGGLAVSIANEACYDARGVPFEGAAIEPDLVVEETPEDRAAGRDPQLEQAVSVLVGQK